MFCLYLSVSDSDLQDSALSFHFHFFDKETNLRLAALVQERRPEKEKEKYFLKLNSLYNKILKSTHTAFARLVHTD